MSKLRFSKAAVDNMALLLATDVEPREIARQFHCHFTTVYRIQQNVDLFGEARPAPLVVMGRPRKITAEALEGLLDWLLDNGDEQKLAYLDEMVYFLDVKYGINVLRQTVSRALSANDITKKAVSTHPLLVDRLETHFVDRLMCC
jgi:transposase